MMEYTLNEIVDANMYTAEFTFNENITGYIYDEDFEIIINDTFNNDTLIINADNIDDYGLLKIEDKSKQIEESIIAHKGLLIYFTAFNKMTFKMLPKCSNLVETIGFYSSDIFISFNGNTEHRQVRFHSSLYPKIIRDKSIIQYKDYTDPILPNINERPGYDYDAGDTEIKTDFKYNSTEDMYVNSDTLEYKDGRVPTYISKLTLYTLSYPALNEYEFELDWKNASSYLLNTTTNVKTEIPYKIIGFDNIHINVIADYYATVLTYDIVQEIYKEEKGRWENKLVFDIGIIDPEDIVHDHIISEIEDENIWTEDEEDYIIEESNNKILDTLITETWDEMVLEDGSFILMEDDYTHYQIIFESLDEIGHSLEEDGLWVITSE